MEDKNRNILLSEEQIKEQIAIVGKKLTEDYKDKNLYVLSLLRGSFIFAADLVRAIDTKAQIGFMTTSSYGHGEESTGIVKVVNDIPDNIEGLDVLIVDDMIASGESVLDIAKELKGRNARNVYVATTFSFFTEGLEKFNKFFNDGIIKSVYSTNLTYIPEELKAAPWFKAVDLSDFIARIINRLNYDKSIASYMDATNIIQRLLDEK